MTTAQAHMDATAAAERAGVSVRELTTDQMAAAAQLLESIWSTAPVPTPMMVALSHAGASVAGAFDGDQLVGVSVGYFAQPLGERLHSHVAGVSQNHLGRGIGRALKFHQRAWCLERGLTRMTWTFDPLVSRNAAFNIRGLGVDIADYLVDFYGDMTDGVNARQGSDRLLASWALDRETTSPRYSHDPGRPATETPTQASASALLTATEAGQPHLHVPDPTAKQLSVAVPADVEGLRHTDPATAATWRGAVRGALAPMIERGWAVTGFHDHRYLLERP